MGIRDRIKGAASVLTGRAAPVDQRALGQRLDAVEARINRTGRAAQGGQREDRHFYNEATGLGMPTYDARAYTRIGRGRVLDEYELEALYLHDDAARKIVDVPVGDAARAGFRVLVNDDEGAGKKTEPFKAHLRRLGAAAALKRAHRYQRQYGGGAIVLVCDDLNPADEPIDFDTLRRVEAIHVFHRFEIRPHRAYATDRLTAKYGTTEIYSLRPSTPYAAVGGGSLTGMTYIHESRVIPFMGREVDEESRGDYEGWGQPTLESAYEAIEALGTLFDTLEIKIKDSIYDLYKVDGIHEMTTGISRTGDRTKLEERLRAAMLVKGVLRAMAIDKTHEEWETRELDFKGVRELFEIHSQRFALASDMPLTKAFGQSPAGFNSKDASGERNYYDGVEGMLGDLYSPALDWLVTVLCHAQFGPTDGKMLEGWEVVYGDLERPSPKEAAEIRKLHTEADKSAIDVGVMSPDEARRRYEDGDFNPSLALERRSGSTGEKKSETRRQEQMPNGAQMTAIKDLAVAAAGEEMDPRAASRLTAFFLGVTDEEARRLLALDVEDVPPADDQIDDEQSLDRFGLPPRRESINYVDAAERLDYAPNSMMLAFYPPAAWAEIAVPFTDHPIEDLHQTLVYLPDVDDDQATAIEALLLDLAGELTAPTLGVTGPATFHNESAIAQVLLLSGIGLNAMRARLTAELADADLLGPQNHDFIPHLTLAYHPPEAPPSTEVLYAPMQVDWPTWRPAALSIVRNEERIDIPLHPGAGDEEE